MCPLSFTLVSIFFSMRPRSFCVILFVLYHGRQVVVFDASIPVQLAFYALVEHGELSWSTLSSVTITQAEGRYPFITMDDKPGGKQRSFTVVTVLLICNDSSEVLRVLPRVHA